MKEILCFAKYAVKRRQAFNQRFLSAISQRFFIVDVFLHYARMTVPVLPQIPSCAFSKSVINAKPFLLCSAN